MTRLRVVLLVAALALLCDPVAALYSKKDTVVQLDPSNWDDEIGSSNEYWIVEFYAPWCGHCKSLAPEWKKAAKALHGSGDARVAAVDCDAHSELAQKFNIKGFPTIKVFAKGGATKKPTDYTGGRTSSDIVAFVKAAVGAADDGSDAGGGVSTKLVKPLKYVDTYSFMYLLETAAPVKVILLSRNDTEVPSWFASLAIKYKKGKDKTAAFAHVTEQAEDQKALAARLGVPFDTLVVVKVSGEGDAWFVPLPLDAKGKGSAHLKVGQAAVDAAIADETPEGKRKSLPAFPSPDKPRKQADATFFRLDEDNLSTKCMGNSKKPVCLVALVAAQGDEFSQQDAVADAAKKYRNDPLSFAWLDAPTQQGFVGALGLQWDGTAKVVAIKSGKRNRFAVMDGELTGGSLARFVDKILGGDVQFSALKETLEVVPAYLQDV